ncbi:MAG TPA: choice-of-anchor D domain-containing protein [Bacteroidota bacterium]|nr:choice-of-anchor D domain-containing protein [Bacteroidota bacterium]
MKKTLILPLLLLAAYVLFSGAVAAQVSFRDSITVTVGAGSQKLFFGVNPGNTIGTDTDPALGIFAEASAPPIPPTTPFDCRFVTIPGRNAAYPIGLGTGVYGDFRGYVSPTAVDSFEIAVQGDNLLSSTTASITWQSNLSQNCDQCTIKSLFSSQLGNTNMIGSTGVTVTLDGSGQLKLLIIKVGQKAPVTGPGFSIDHASLDFGTVGVGVNATQTVRVSNGGTQTLNISAITTPADYFVTPAAPVAVAAGSFQDFVVRFTPSSPGTKSGNVVFTHNATGSPSSLAVTGNGLSQLGTLSFKTTAKTLLDNTANIYDSLNLSIAGNPLKGVQFTLKTSGQLIFRSITHTLNPANWSLAYNIVRGPQNAFGATDDSVNVLLYGNGANALAAGTYSGIFAIKYDVVNISTAQEVSSIKIRNLLGSLADGTNANVSSGGDEAVTVKNRTAKGDINLDDHVDILDLLLIVDHITGKSTLTGSQFSSADIYPYPNGDGAVNVQDLSLLQNVILTGMYPDGQRIQKTVVAPVLASNLKKVGQTMDARVTAYVTPMGIAIHLQNNVPVKGLQVSLGNIHAMPAGVKATTSMGNVFYGVDNEGLNVLLFSTNGDVVAPGERTVAVLPFSLVNASGVTLTSVVLAGADNRVVTNAETVLSHEQPEELPSKYALQQNYPNPFNPSTEIRFSVPQTSAVKLVIYNALGQEVRTLVAGEVEQGTQVVRWDGRDNRGNTLSSGMYIYRMTAGNFSQSHKMMLLK